MLETYPTIEPIGVIHSPFKEKFGIPRQASLIKSCSATIELFKPYNSPDACRGLSEFSDIWLIFGFHKNNNNSWRPLVRPPRLGGNQKVGVFASRSPFRPNGLGLSRVELRQVINRNDKIILEISCPDAVDGTPIFDIKPYIHYADSNNEAQCGFAKEPPRSKYSIVFSSKSLNAIKNLEHKKLKEVITEVLEQDPSPAYQNTKSKRYGFRLFDLNIIWEKSEHIINVIDVTKFEI